jgi:aspartate racemase
MKKFGLVGGLSWTSTARYYQIINQGVAKRLGGLHSAPLVIESLDFAEVARCASAQDWDCAATQLIAAAQNLEKAGAQGVVICANSMHTIYDRIAAAIAIPVIHIADVVGDKMQADGIKSAALVGTRNVMTEKFYRQRLVSRGVSLMPPDMELADRIDTIVYDTLMLGKSTREAERYMKSELTDIAKAQVQAVVLACTELEMIVDVRANVLPIYDSTSIHANAALDFILSE